MADPKIINGVNVDELFNTINSVKSSPVIATFKFKANNKWIKGGHNRTSIKNFYGVQKDNPHKKPFELDADEPPLLLGEDIAQTRLSMPLPRLQHV